MFGSWGGTFPTVSAEGAWIESTAKNVTVVLLVATVAAQSMATEKFVIIVALTRRDKVEGLPDLSPWGSTDLDDLDREDLRGPIEDEEFDDGRNSKVALSKKKRCIFTDR